MAIQTEDFLNDVFYILLNIRAFGV